VFAPLSPVGFGPVLSDALARFFLGFPLKRKANGYSLRRSQISSPRARSRSMAMSLLFASARAVASTSESGTPAGAAGAAAQGTGCVQETMGRHRRNSTDAENGADMGWLCTHRVAP